MKKNATFEQEISAIGDRKRFLHVVIGNENAYVTIFQAPHNVLNILHSNRVYARKRLVEHDEFRVDGKATCYLRTAAFASRKLVALVLSHLVQTELTDETLQFLELLGMRKLRHFKHSHDVILNTQLAKHAGFLRKITYTSPRPLVNGVVGNIFIVEINMAFVGYNVTRCHIERRSFARTVRPEKSYNLTLFDVDAYPIGHRSFAIALHKAFCSERCQICFVHIFFHFDAKLVEIKRITK